MKRILPLLYLLFIGSHLAQAQSIVINEVNADSPSSTETAEFVELFGPANTSLNGYTLAFCNGSDQTYYYEISLDNQSLDANGFFVVGSLGMPNIDLAIPFNTIQNGYDAIALYDGPSNLYNIGNDVIATNLVDVLVYETDDASIGALLSSLGLNASSYSAFNEVDLPNSDDLSQSRIPDGGLAMSNDTYQNRPPSPGYFNAPPSQEVSIVFNEVNADNPGVDVFEFVELLGPANASLNGYVLAFCDGVTLTYDTVIYLNGYQLDENGFFVAGNSSVNNVDLVFEPNSIGNGTDAVALYFEPNLIFEGDIIMGGDLVDAFVYTTEDPLIPALVSFLGLSPDYTVLDESPPSSDESLSRVPDGGIAFENSTFVMQSPTPGTWNASSCSAGNPQLSNGDTNAEFCLGGNLSINLAPFPGNELGLFVVTNSNGIIVSTITNGVYTFANTVGNYKIYSVGYLGALDNSSIQPGQPLMGISASDCLDISVYFISISVTDCGVLTNMVINELNADNPSTTDTEEFIELLGPPYSPLNGLVVVFLDGNSGTIYDAIDLDGYYTDEYGFFVLGNAATQNVDYVFPNAHLQNGPDGVAIFVGDTIDHPLGSVVGSSNLIDAMIYQTDDAPAENLIMNLELDGLTPPYVDFNETNQSIGEVDLTQSRFPNGGPALTSSNIQLQPATPGTFNNGVFVSEEIRDVHFKMFPNPTADRFNIQINNSSSESISVRIVDIGGRLVYSNVYTVDTDMNFIELNAQSWANGFYVVELQVGDYVGRMNLIKN